MRVALVRGPCGCLGIGPTKTLAKLVNRVAKKGAGVVDLSDRADREAAMATCPAGDLWGVDPRWAAKLASLGIHTAAHLRGAPPDLLMEQFGVVLTRTQRELQGHPCMGLEDVEPDRQQIMVSRSFGKRVEDQEAVAQAIATFAVRACEKLRRRGLVASALSEFAHTDAFRPELCQHHPAHTAILPVATSDTRIVLVAVRAMMRGMLRAGFGCKKAGICLMDLARPQDLQGDLFSPATVGDVGLMATVDRINRKFGSGTAGFGASGWVERPAWGMRQLQRSPRFTTRLSDLPRAFC